MATLMIPNEEMDDIMKIVKFLEKSDLLMKDVSKTIRRNKQTSKVFVMILGT